MSLEYIEISQALIRQENHFLMQLRDFKPDIESPGQWGFFAGHHTQGENAEETMYSDSLVIRRSCADNFIPEKETVITQLPR